MKLIAICVGLVAPMTFRTSSGELRTVATGIAKQAISSGKDLKIIEVRKLGLEQDEQCDLSVHGGLDKAVYMMPAEHYAFWKERRKEAGLSTDITWGMLGENLVTQGLSESTVRIGDEFEIGSARFRVTQPRQPCYKFAIRMGYGAAPRQMVQQGNCGWYLSVLTPGNIQAGQTIVHHPNPQGQLVIDRFRILTRKSGQMDLL